MASNQKKLERTKLKEKYYKKHMGNMNEGQGFTQTRKDKAVKEYLKQRRKENKRLTHQPGTKARPSLKPVSTKRIDKKHKHKTVRQLGKFHKAQRQFEVKAAEAKRKREVLDKVKKERHEALSKYKEEKKKTHKKLSKKNYKGQPNMASQMDVLLQKIQKSHS